MDLDVRRRAGRERRGLLIAGAAGLLLLLASYVPLAIHEVSTDFAELRAAVAFATGGGEPSSMSLPIRFLVIGLRVLAWPLVGLITEAPIAAIVAAAGVIAAIGWRWRAGSTAGRRASRWFGLTLLWTTAALSVAASGLATVVPRLPNDHYHAFADPIVFVAVGLGIAGLARLPGRASEGRRGGWTPGAVLAGALVVAIVGFNLVRQPPLVSPDGGWPAGDVAAERVLRSVQGQTEEPPIVRKPPGLQVGRRPSIPARTAWRRRPGGVGGPDGHELLPHVVLCDALFERAIGAACGGPAEDARSPHTPAARRPLRGGAGSLGVGTSRSNLAGHANAGAPDAGVRCPETRSWRANRVVPG